MRIAYNPGDALTYAPNSEDIIFDLTGEAIFAKGVRFDGKLHTVFRKEFSNDGVNGLVPYPDYNEGSSNRFLKEDGTWEVPYRHILIDNNPIIGDDETVLNLIAGDFIKFEPNGRDVTVSATYERVTPEKDGLMSYEDKVKLDYLNYDTTIFNGTLENAFTLVAAGTTILNSSENLCLTLSVDTGLSITASPTDQSVLILGVEMTGSTSNSDGETGLVPKPYWTDSKNYLRGDGTWGDTIENANNAGNADTVDGYHIEVTGTPGTDPNTIYFVL